MKLSLKLAGLLGSGVFILTALPGFYQQVRPVDIDSMMSDPLQGMSILETLGFSLLGAVVAGGIGYKIGDILSKPKGNSPRGRGAKPQKPTAQASRDAAKPVTGEESFLDDVTPGPAQASPPTAEAVNAPAPPPMETAAPPPEVGVPEEH